MDLFDNGQTGEDVKLGFRLQRLEVYNWGTFDQKVWSLDVQGDTSLLTGDVGSGKSTLVDALITLLVPPKKVTYNKAADASAKERSLASYVRGYFAQKRTDDGGGRPEALRDRNQYSVILGVFGDENLGVRVTLAQVFWFRDETTNYPARFYVLAEKTLSIKERFSNLGSDMRGFKKRLEQDAYIHVYDDYPPYGREFRRRFGIRQEQALDLFQQTISMKKVDELTGFVRQNMLEKPDTENDVRNLLEHFRDLDAAHHAVVKAKEQQELLKPLVTDGEQYRMLFKEQDRMTRMQDMLSAWFAEKEQEFLLQEKQHLEESLTGDRSAQIQGEVRQKQAESALEETQDAIKQNGGSRLALLKAELKLTKAQQDARKNQRERYHKQADVLFIPLPDEEGEFQDNIQKISEQLQMTSERAEQLMEEISTADNNRKDAEKSIEKTAAELSSLRKRKSSIPSQYIDLRQQLCTALNLAESEMPFAGELMEVRGEEGEWEGALERLLHGFGISLLVPQVHYAEAADWLERHPLQLKLVYYRVKEYQESVDFMELPEDCACQKLNLREDSPFYPWLTAELAQRFRHICCDTLSDFQKEKFALTKAGQIKVNGHRHEKDDRYAIDDRRRYVLGFSNLKKIQALEAEMMDWEEERKHWQKAYRQARAEQKKGQAAISACQILLEVKDFSELDVHSLQEKIDELEELLIQLEKENEVLKQLKEKADRLALQLESIKRANLLLHDSILAAENRLRGIQVRLQQTQNLYGAFSETQREAVYPWIAKAFFEALPGHVLTPKLLGQQENDLRTWLNKNRTLNQEALLEQGQKVTMQMSQYMLRYPGECDALTASLDALEEYQQVLNRLERDELPKFETKFRQLLRENTINQIALFQGKLNTACDVIRERIEMINQSLADIDYNEGRYIQLECNPSLDEEIRRFRIQLRACTDNVLTASEEDTYSEAKFDEVREIIDRFRGRPNLSDLDEKWTKRVIDVRNWFSFAASERWRETDEEYEHYTDSGGKSGGQKEKLAYTILAASLVYNFGLEAKRRRIETFRFVVIDEAFLKSSDDSARFGLELFKKLDLQLLVVTPLLKIATIEPFVTHVGFVYQHDEEHRSYLRNLTLAELQEERQEYEQTN